MKPPVPHLPAVDPDVPADHKGRPYCRCGVPIEPGDPRHTLPPTTEPDARELAAGDHDESEAP